MSGWDQYVDYLVKDKICQHGYIVGKQDGLIWATNSGLKTFNTYDVTVEDKSYSCNEAKLLVAACQNKGVPTDPNIGIRINNEKYYTVHFDQDAGTWYLKKDKGGASIAITNLALVIGTFSLELGQVPGKVNEICEKLAQSLKASNY
ncbi:profilin family protein, putative [Ichthyophthirius multifiliis]|uniref:Profilin n=1 Tax=Ichthyophthirius multifiliis TaxID=5932 RepID=G0QKQ3_ICHMU|nr:profilin family protein, putative [Ichthyophthirius multifiliis]EGR34207.1 profilin family protein, putative [Ichthyophthirius multifiliis]|eukprot:XP_004039511.1 profilin family protein, putative [Ichthyophthirius multifiliis]